MDKTNTIDINVVCRLLGTTSRTLRYYEEKGIITSTVTNLTNRRRYTPTEVELIKKVLVLRSLGLSVSSIKELQHSDIDLTHTVEARKAKIQASIMTKIREIRLLEGVFAAVTREEDIFADKPTMTDMIISDKIVDQCTNAFISGDFEIIFSCFSEKQKEDLPISELRQIVKNTLLPIGEFISKDRTEKDPMISGTYYSYLNYERMRLCIKYVLLDDQIHGIQFGYCEDKIAERKIYDKEE